MAFPLLPIAVGFLAGVATTLWAREHGAGGVRRTWRADEEGGHRLPVDAEPVEDTVGWEARSAAEERFH